MLSIRTFGGLEIWLDERGQPAGEGSGGGTACRITFETRTVDALLVYVACQGRPVGRDFLAELLWPERTQKQARANLNVTIHRLRRQLEPYLLVTRQTVALNPDTDIFLDIAHFETNLARGHLGEAIALYGGNFLDGFYRDGSPAFEQWALLERERLRIQAIAVYQRLIGQTVAAGQLDAAIHNAQRLLHLDSLHEPTHRQLMRLLAQVDQRSAALAQYEICVQLLSIEFGALPDESTTALYQQIRSGEFDESTRASDSPLPSTGPYAVTGSASSADPVALLPLYNLPSQPTPLIGREAELGQIANLLSNPDCRLLTLLGIGGIGKTRLAVESATRQASRFAEGVCYIPLAPIATAESMAVAMAQSLGLHVTSSDLVAEIAAHLQPRAMLLILDNFEHLLEAAQTVAHLLAKAPHLKILVTSRERLYLREEWIMPVAGLSLAQALAGEAGQLFLRSGQRVKPDFTGDGEEEAIADLCRQVEGMPLALELAASWVRIMSCAEIARHMRGNLDLLTTGVRNLPARHRSIRALFDGSWQLLSPAEQEVLRRVSVFQGGWTWDEAAEVAGATFALLVGLVDKSLVRASGLNRFDLHELVRQYAVEQLTASGESEVMRERHYATYLQLFRTADSHLRRPEAATWLARIEPEQDNLRAALQWALDKARYEDAAWLLMVVSWFWYLRGNWYENGRWLAQIVPHRHVLGNELRLSILIGLYVAAGPMEEFQPVDRFTDEVMALLEVCEHKLLHATVWHCIASSSSDFSQAAAAWERGIALARAAGDEPPLGIEFGRGADRNAILATLLYYYAECLVEYGEFAQAEPLARESLALYQIAGNPYESGDSLGLLGHLALLRGDLAQAHTLFREAITCAAAYSYLQVLSRWQPPLGLVALYNDDATEARRLLNNCLQISIELNDKDLRTHICAYLAEVALWEGELDQANEWLAQSLDYPAESRPRVLTMYHVVRLFVAARLSTALHEYARAAVLFGLAGQAQHRIHDAIAGPIRLLADEARTLSREALGAACFDEAFATGQQLSLDEAFDTILAPSHIRSLANIAKE